MSFFKDFKDDLSQAVNELMPGEELQGEEKKEGLEQPDVVVEEHEVGHLQDVEVGEADDYRDQNRHNGEQGKDYHEGSDHDVCRPVALHTRRRLAFG